MPRPHGTPKTGGRKSGTPNRRTGQLADQLAALGLDVPAEIAKALPDLNAELRVKVLMDLMTFLFPKRKAIEHSGEVACPQAPEDREATPEEKAERHARLIKFTKTMIVLDKEVALTVIKTLVDMKTNRTLPAEGQALLVENF
jgi:hypothetical protein